MQSIRRLTLCVALISLVYSTQAENPTLVNNPDLVINPVLKKFDEKKSTINATNGATVTEKEEHWGYITTLENKSFKPIPDLQLKYIVFYKQDTIGMKSATRFERQTGTAPIQGIPAGGIANFTTEHLKLKKEVLNGNYYFKNGAKNRAEDGVMGIWIRVYLNGTLFAETVHPESLINKEKWE